jgi:Flp pilus assembly protein CpaB
VVQGEGQGARWAPPWLAWFWGPGRRRRWRRLVLRRLLAATCAAGAVAGVLAAARAPQHVETRPVVVASQAIAVGQVVDAASVRVARWPAPLVPDGALGSLSAAVGRPASSPMGTGEPVTSTRLSASALLAGQGAGTVAVHVALVDGASASMVDEGERVDLLGPSGPVASDVVVLRVDRSTSDGAGRGHGLGADLSVSPDGTAAGMVVATDQQTAAAVAATPLDALGRPALTVVLRSR